jgi:hypothetical protein
MGIIKKPQLAVVQFVEVSKLCRRWDSNSTIYIILKFE